MNENAVVEHDRLFVSAGYIKVKLEGKKEIEHLHAHDRVTLVYNKQFSASADRVDYTRAPETEENGNHPFPGKIVMKANNDVEGVCQLSNVSNDLINAQQMTFDTVKNVCVCENADGKIHIEKNDKESNGPCIDFSADIVTWDANTESVALEGNIVVQQGALGTVKNHEKIELFQERKNGKSQLKSIMCHGETFLTYVDEEEGLSHYLKSYGSMRIDHQLYRVTLESPRSSDGTVKAGQQVHFRDSKGEMYADELILDYGCENNKMAPLKLVLKGNVHIRNQFSTNPDPKNPLLQYALADLVVYDFGTQMMQLSATGDRRVLFLDKINNVHVSAPALKARRDLKTGKESIQGVGDVRFTFVKQELEQLKERFQLEKEDESSE